MNHTPPAASATPAMPLTASLDARPRESAVGRLRVLALRAPRPELVALTALAGVLNLWALSRNGWANTYYAGAVRSMSTSWHDFLYASLDRSGVMTVDKPPLALWVQALSVRIFGYHPLSVLVPQALMGVASVALVYDLVRRRFGRIGGFVAGAALAVTPMTVAISRHNNPDALLVLCCVAAVWCAVRALEHGSTRWLVAAGVSVGLGFETKMGVALTVVPGIALAWLWCSPAGRGRLQALRALLAGGGAMLLVGGAWPALVALTPAADRPWVSGTSNNSIFSLIFEYNGLGRVDGQTGGPGGAAGNMFGGSAGPLRLLGSALGGQAGWLLGFALVAGVAILVSSRLRRTDPRTGWLIAVGGALLATAVLFSAASGIFHPYYVSLLAPFVAAMFGAGAAQLTARSLPARIIAPLAVIAGVAVELVIRSDYPGQLSWLAPVLIVVGVLAAVALAAFHTRAARLGALAAVVSTLMIAPAVWAFDTLGYATSTTFPAGGPAAAESGGFGGPGAGFPGGLRAGRFGVRGGSAPQLFGLGVVQGTGQAGGTQTRGARPQGPPPGAQGGAFPGGPPPGAQGGNFARGGPGGFGGDVSTAVLSYVAAHGGGTIAVSSQSSAASAILAGHSNVAGIGGFSGRESDVSVAWLAQEVATGKIRWVLGEASGTGFGRGVPGDTRTGSRPALAAVAKLCTKAKVSSSAAATSSLYDCRGAAAALAGSVARESSS